MDRQKKRDFSEIAKGIVDQATGEDEPPLRKGKKARMSPAAELGRKGGLKGGKARAAKLSAEQRREIAKKAAKARWGHKKSEGPK